MGNFKKIDDERVNQFIQWSQASAKYFLWKEGNTSPTVVEINRLSWQLLKTVIRGDPAHQYDHDFDAAAAEHYMYIRFLAGATGDPTCHTAPALYGLKKVVDQLFGRLQAGQAQGGHPVLPSNPYIVAWGQQGVLDGLADYKAENKGATYKIGTAVGVLAGFATSKEWGEKIGNYAAKIGNTLPDYVK